MLPRTNVLAGLGGYGWMSLLQLAAAPILIRVLGTEAFGLFGFYLAIQGLTKVFEFGIGPTINREMSIAAAKNDAAPALDLLFTVERGYWIVGMILGLALAVVAPLLAIEWFEPGRLPASAIRRDLIAMGLLLAAQWPIALYEAVLTGLQRIPRLHAIGFAARTLGVGAGLMLVTYWRAELWVYVLSLAVASLLHVILLLIGLREALPRLARPPRTDMRGLRERLHFTGGAGTLAILSAVLIHTDKLVLSGSLTLTGFGHYVLASMLASGLYVLAQPVFFAAAPVLAGRVAAADAAGERKLYHLGSESLAALVVPAAAVMVCFAADLMTAWTSDSLIAAQTTPLLRLLVVGTTLNVMMSLPYALQLAHGEVWLAVRIHIYLIAFYVPAVLIASFAFGAIGAAFAWLSLNSIYLVLGILATHRRMLQGEALRWLRQDVVSPTVTAVSVVLTGYLVTSTFSTSSGQTAIGAVVTLCGSWAACLGSSTRLRTWLSSSTTHPGS